MDGKPYVSLLCAGLFLIGTAQKGEAALGEPADSVAKDRIALSAQKRASTARNGFTVQEFELSGTFVRQYISPSGIVFAIAWNGLTYPDLTPLLASYADEYKAALRETPRKPGISRRHAVRTDRVVVEKWGHMRNLQGRAYAPALIPPGVNLEEIK